jgi:hypothetical protein
MNVYSEGDYPMEFIVTNSMGDTSTLPVTVKLCNPVVENSLPQIRLKQYLINTPVGTGVNLDDMIEDITYRGYVFNKSEDGNYYCGEYTTNGEAIMISSNSLKRTGTVDFETPGVYEITYTYEDAENEIENYSRLYVVVAE